MIKNAYSLLVLSGVLTLLPLVSYADETSPEPQIKPIENDSNYELSPRYVRVYSAFELEQQNFLSITTENDLFGNGTDQHYTNGIKFTYLTPRAPNQLVLKAAQHVPFFASDDATVRGVFTLGQNLYTPVDISIKELQPESRPYAGWLYGGLGVVAASGAKQGASDFEWSSINYLELDVGMVGPSALGEQTQTIVHEIIDYTLPEGWDNQLKDEPAFVLFFDRQYRGIGSFNLGSYDLQYEMTPSFGWSLGTVATHASAGVSFRIGDGLDRDFGAPRIRPAQSGVGYFESSNTFGWYAFAGVEGRAVAHNIFLDGNVFHDSHSVDKETFVGDFNYGVGLTYSDWRLIYSRTMRTKEFKNQDESDVFGSITLTKRF
jgi:lipid A 3-O-deacylase